MTTPILSPACSRPPGGRLRLFPQSSHPEALAVGYPQHLAAMRAEVDIPLALHTVGESCYCLERQPMSHGQTGASLRGDFGRIIVERDSNIQDTCVLHSAPGADMIVAQEGHIGHGAVLHGCRIGKNVLVGINAVVMDEADIGEWSMIAACTFVKTGFTCDPRSLIVGVPGKQVRTLTNEETAWKREMTAHYKQLAVRCLNTFREIEPLTEAEPDRRRFEPDRKFQRFGDIGDKK